MAQEQTRRGSYAKGIAKREEILRRALDVIAREGYRGASVKELADAVGLSQAGLLHYFDSKEELFAEILRKRDEVDMEVYGPGDDETIDYTHMRELYLRIVRHNTEVPGLVQLFSRMAVDAADPEHPAHDFFLRRGEQLRDVWRTSLASHQADGTLTSSIDPDALARIFQAVADGLQLQWMLDPTFDMAAVMDALFTALIAPGASERADHE
jgi:AcrR family transcriptional regulator